MAGAKGAVTVATNMAGRGTDIMLGGNVEFMAHATLAERGLDAEEDPEGYQQAWDEELKKAKSAVAEQHDEVVELGGDRKSTRLNSSHVAISYAVFCLKKKNKLRL